MVQTYLDHLDVERGMSVHTLTNYRRDLDRYVEHLTDAGRADLAEVTDCVLAPAAQRAGSSSPCSWIIPSGTAASTASSNASSGSTNSPTRSGPPSAPPGARDASAAAPSGVTARGEGG